MHAPLAVGGSIVPVTRSHSGLDRANGPMFPTLPVTDSTAAGRGTKSLPSTSSYSAGPGAISAQPHSTAAAAALEQEPELVFVSTYDARSSYASAPGYGGGLLEGPKMWPPMMAMGTGPTKLDEALRRSKALAEKQHVGNKGRTKPTASDADGNDDDDDALALLHDVSKPGTAPSTVVSTTVPATGGKRDAGVRSREGIVTPINTSDSGGSGNGSGTTAVVAPPSLKLPLHLTKHGWSASTSTPSPAPASSSASLQQQQPILSSSTATTLQVLSPSTASQRARNTSSTLARGDAGADCTVTNEREAGEDPYDDDFDADDDDSESDGDGDD